MLVLLSVQNILQALRINISIFCIPGMKSTLYRKSTACQAYAKVRVACQLSFKKFKRKADKEQTSKRSRTAVSKYLVDKKWKVYIKLLLEQLIIQVGNLVGVVNWVRDKLGKVLWLGKIAKSLFYFTFFFFSFLFLFELTIQERSMESIT